MNWFGKKKPAAPTTTSKPSSSSGGNNTGATIVKLKESIAAQDKREEHNQRKIDDLVTQAKAKMAKGDKKGALHAMKLKKLKEGELDKIQNIKMTLETQVLNLESAHQNAETFAAIKAGKNAMTNIRNEVGIENVDDLMTEVQEEMEQAQEISEAFAQPVDPLAADEDELLAELEGLEADDLEKELLAAPGVPSMALPSVPAKMPQNTKAQKEAAEMKQLEAELAGL